MAIITVSGQAEFTAALTTVQAGDTLVLADGDYGTLAMTADFAQPIIITSANPHGASFDKISLTNATNVQFDNLTITTGFSATGGSSGVTLTGCDMQGGMAFRDTSFLTVENCILDVDLMGITLRGVQDFVIRGNVLHTAREDLLRITGNTYNGLVEANSFLDMLPVDNRATGGGYVHCDAIQFFALDGVTPHDIVIRGNHIWDDPATGAPTTTPQGIFLADAGPEGYRNILIENNLINVSSSNSISIANGTQNVVVRNNTLIPNAADDGAVIRLTGNTNSGVTVTGNVMKLLDDRTGDSIIGNNYIYGRGADPTTLFSGSGDTPGDFVPPAGSPIPPGYGALVDGTILPPPVDTGGGTGGGTSVTVQNTATLAAVEKMTTAFTAFLADAEGADAAKISFDDERFRIPGSNLTPTMLDVADMARAAGRTDLLRHTAKIELVERSFPNGAHVAEVEIDPETGVVKVVKYSVVDDFGNLINPMLAQGQVHGGIAQGLGQAITERTVYDSEGQLLTATFMDYAMPRADDMPMIAFASEPTPSINNPMGMKGCGEAGTVGALAAVTNAVQDALWPFGLTQIDMPFTPQRVWALLQQRGDAAG